MCNRYLQLVYAVSFGHFNFQVASQSVKCIKNGSLSKSGNTRFISFDICIYMLLLRSGLDSYGRREGMPLLFQKRCKGFSL